MILTSPGESHVCPVIRSRQAAHRYHPPHLLSKGAHHVKGNTRFSVVFVFLLPSPVTKTGFPHLATLGSTSEPQPKAAVALKMNGKDKAEEFPFLTLQSLEEEIRESSSKDATYLKSMKASSPACCQADKLSHMQGKCKTTIASFAKTEKLAVVLFEEGKRKLRSLHEHMTLQKRFWKASRSI